ncbi:MAG: NfeD family protein [Opitutales bacterium]|jgi:membrane-bound ClpP family serine protease
MSLIIGLVITAFILFFFEIFLPGGVLAVLGGMLLLGASALTYTEFGLAWAVLLLCGGLIAALVMFFLEIRFITHSRFGQQLALQSTIAARLNPKADDKLVGTEGVTLTILAPTGKVQVDGRIHTAQAEDGYLEKGQPVRVVRTETFKLIVTRK